MSGYFSGIRWFIPLHYTARPFFDRRRPRLLLFWVAPPGVGVLEFILIEPSLRVVYTCFA